MNRTEIKPPHSRRAITIVTALLLVASILSASADDIPRKGAHVGDTSLTLKDVSGKERKPFDLGADRASVLIFVLHDCPIANAYAPEISRIAAAYKTQPVRLALVYVDPDLTLKEINRHRKEYGHEGYTAFFDRKHQLVKATVAEVTPEAAVIDSSGRIAYRGRISNLYADYGKRRREATRHDLRAAIDAVLAGRPVATPRTEALGCFIPKLD